MRSFILKIIASVLICMTFSSCSWNVEPLAVTDAVTSASGEEFFASMDKTANYDYSSERVRTANLMTAPGMLMFKYDRRAWMICHNPQTGESRILCANPSCSHDTYDCVMVHFRTSHAITYYDGYLYIMYVYPDVSQDKYSGLIRMSLDGTNIEYLYHMNPRMVNSMKAHEGYIYINDISSGLYRYCIETGEMKQIGGDRIIYNGFALTDHGILLNCFTDKTIYLMDYDLKEKKKLFPMGALVYQGDTIYRVKIYDKADGKAEGKIEFYEYDIETGNERYITEDVNTGGFYCVADGYMYYSPKADVKIGDYLNETGGILYQVNISTGEKKTVFNDPTLDIENVYCINGKMYGEIYSRNVYECGLPASLTSRARLFGEFVDRDNDGTWEFEPFVWDTSMFEIR